MEFEERQAEPDAVMLAKAVQRWFDFYEIDRTQPVQKILCEAAIQIHNEGYRSLDEIATVLIATYVGVPATKVNAPSSASVH